MTSNPFDALRAEHPSFDAGRFAQIIEALRQEQANPAPQGQVEGNRDGDIVAWPAEGSPERAEYAERGAAALRRGELALVIVAGGAGTRFGGAVKGLVPVLGQRTFLDLKLVDAERAQARYGRAVPVVLMTSDLTHEGIEKALGERLKREPITLVQQAMLPRLRSDFGLYFDAHGKASWAPAGHGDVYRVLRESGVGQKLHAAGVRHLAFSNVDNLAATVDPVVLGFHIAGGQSATVEVTARKSPAGLLDTGAAPVRIGGHLQLMEKADPERFPHISTNNILFRLDTLLENHIVPPWRAVKKKLEGGDEVVQLEQVTAEATSLLEGGKPVLPTVYLEVPRLEPSNSRFEPVKVPDDLPRVAERMKSRF